MVVANNKISDLQASLLRAGHRKQTKSDNALSREWHQLANETKTWAIEYFTHKSKNIDLSQELYQTLQDIAPDYQELLKSKKSKVMVVRAVVAYVLQESFANMEFSVGDASLAKLYEWVLESCKLSCMMSNPLAARALY